MSGQPLDTSFYNTDAQALAKQLLGTILVHDSPAGRTTGIIVETEAYLGGMDPASHAYGGRTARNRIMFESGGLAYIYFTYGLHYCCNVVAGSAGSGEAVLLRALEPLDGLELMMTRRRSAKLADLTNGPAKLVQAMGITRDLYGHDFSQPPLTICQGTTIPPNQIVAKPRVGISAATELPLRFYIQASPFVSRA